MIRLAKRHGYVYQGFWDGMYYFAKRIDEMSKECLTIRYKCIKCEKLDIDNENIELMLQKGITK